jgi:hypothetical protein
MAYRENETDFLPLGTRDNPPTAMEWAVAGFAVLVAVVMMLSAIAGESAPAWLRRLHLWPIGIVEFAAAWTMWLRARADRPEEAYSPRSLRLLAFTLLLLGATTIAVAGNLFKGA